MAKELTRSTTFNSKFQVISMVYILQVSILLLSCYSIIRKGNTLFVLPAPVAVWVTCRYAFTTQWITPEVINSIHAWLGYCYLPATSISRATMQWKSKNRAVGVCINNFLPILGNQDSRYSERLIKGWSILYLTLTELVFKYLQKCI